MHPLFVHATHEENLVVHRQPEENRNHDDRQEGFDRTAAHVEHRATPTPLEYGDDDTEGCAGGQKVHDCCGGRNQQTPEGEEQQEAAEQDNHANEERKLVGKRLSEVVKDGR